MKPTIEKPSECVMRFFTPDLYRRFNSDDDAIADRADADWEVALEGYRTHLDGIRDEMAPEVQSLTELCLHDSEWIGSHFDAQSRFSSRDSAGVAILSVMSEGELVSLVYTGGDRPREFPSSEDWPFSKSQKHWLYDEVDRSPDRSGYVHRIMFSDGTVLVVPFLGVVVSRMPMLVPARSH